MVTPIFSDDELLAFLDELLPVERMTVLEQALRSSKALRNRAAALAQKKDHGFHSVGECWRRSRLSCPSRSQLGSYLLGTLDSEFADYVTFHLQTVGCRYCGANLRDLQTAREAEPEVTRRREKFFQSSAGYLSGR